MLQSHGIELQRCTSVAELKEALTSRGPHEHRYRPRAVLSTLQKFASMDKTAKTFGGTALGMGAGAGAGGGSEDSIKRLRELVGGGGGGGGGKVEVSCGSGVGRVALIADEAHRSYGGATSIAINEMLGGRAGL
jgi:type I site-specific restriction-modification system R (restriction) subunit